MGRHSIWVPVTVAALMVLLNADHTAAVAVSAEVQNSGQTAVPASQPRKRELGITPEREAAALTFARNNAPELVELLDFLRKNRTRQYRRAILDLFRTSERLATIQEREPARYSAELKMWKAKARIELLVARLQLNDSEQLRAELQATVQTLMATQHKLLVEEQTRLQERLRKLDRQIHQWDPSDQDAVKRQTDLFLDRPGKGPRKDKK